MTDIEQRILGKLEQACEDLKIQAERNRQESQQNFAELFRRMNELQVEGCALGRRNLERIEKLEQRPATWAAVAHYIISAVVGAGAALAAAWTCLKETYHK